MYKYLDNVILFQADVNHNPYRASFYVRPVDDGSIGMGRCMTVQGYSTAEVREISLTLTDVRAELAQTREDLRYYRTQWEAVEAKRLARLEKRRKKRAALDNSTPHVLP